MAKYGVVENKIITNVIVAESKELAESITGQECIEYTHNELGVGWYWNDEINQYIEPCPYDSWTFNVENQVWEAPIPMPVEDGKFFSWDEKTLSWTPHDILLGE